MNIGTSQIDITPEPGIDLSGFAARRQPSTGVLDRLYARALYLSYSEEKLLWLHCDLIGLEHKFVSAFRIWAHEHIGIASRQIILSTTHTHAGPPTLHIQETGTYNSAYVHYLMKRLEETAQQAYCHQEESEVVAVEGISNLAVDRHSATSPQTDPAVAAIAWRRKDGTFIAALINYPMHAVALGCNNRDISADIPGQIAEATAKKLPGNPIVLATTGACGNLNPPAENVSAQQVRTWGEQIADAVIPLLSQAAALNDPILKVTSRNFPISLEVLSPPEIHEYAKSISTDAKSVSEWGDKFQRAVEAWKRTMLHAVARPEHTDTTDAELFLIRIGSIVLVGINAELFSSFTNMLRRQTGKTIYTICYANGVVGYLPDAAAYKQGGYEVNIAHIFYNSFRPRAGSLELLADATVHEIQNIFKEL